jgi:hypothetical protein
MGPYSIASCQLSIAGCQIAGSWSGLKSPGVVRGIDHGFIITWQKS